MATGDATFECASCGKRFRWKPEFAGKRVKCKCNEVVTVPERNPLEPDPMEMDDDFVDLGAVNEWNGDVSSAATESVSAPSGGAQSCPSCGASAKASAVICISCGYNFQDGKALDTVIAKPVKQGGGARSGRRAYDGAPDGFFGKIRRSWEFAKISYGIIWDYKSLLVFPLLSGIATLIVLVSFLAPLAGPGTLEEWMAFMDDQGTNDVPITAYAMTFTFYFLCYFVIIFFNTALTAAALKVCDGEKPTVKYGLSIACRRIYQIVSWAMVSALVGVLLKMIENAHEKAGKFISAIIGSAWTILTYFVVPVLCTEGVGPGKAMKESVNILKNTWGTALVGNFSLGVLSFIVLLPLYLIIGVIIYLGVSGNSQAMTYTGIGLLIVVVIVSAIVTSAADIVFKSLLYNYATGRNIPADLDDEMLDRAFAMSDD